MENEKTLTRRRVAKGAISKFLAFAGYLAVLVVASAFATWGVATFIGFDPLAEEKASLTLLVALMFIAADLSLALFWKWSPVWLIYSVPIGLILLVIQRRGSIVKLATEKQQILREALTRIPNLLSLF